MGKKKILFLVMMFSFFNVVSADECSVEKINQYKELAKNITVDTEFDDRYTYLQEYETNHITINGLSEGFYLQSKNLEHLYEYEDVIDGIITSDITSEVKKLYVYNENCPNQILKEIKLELKKYNAYADYEECEGISGEELDVCGEFYSKNITETEFQRRVKEYKDSLKKEPLEKIEKDNKNYIYIGIVVGIVVLIALVVTIIIKRKKNRLD